MVLRKNISICNRTSKKAFDGVPRDIVLQKIEMLGIGGNF